MIPDPDPNMEPVVLPIAVQGADEPVQGNWLKSIKIPPPLFAGNQRDPLKADTYIKQLKTYFALHKVPNDGSTKVDLLFTAIDTTTAFGKWFVSVYDTLDTYETFESAFLKEYSATTQAKQDLLNQWHSYTQRRKDSVDTWAQQIRTLRHTLHSVGVVMDDDTTLRAFRHGLHKPLKEAVNEAELRLKLTEHLDFHMALGLAKNFERIHPRSTNGASTSSTPGGSQIQKQMDDLVKQVATLAALHTPKRYDSKNRGSKSKPKWSDEQTSRYQKGQCFKCGKPGHLSRDCTE